MVTSLIVLMLLAAVDWILWRLLPGPPSNGLRRLPGILRGALGIQELADLQRQSASEITRLATVSVESRFLPNDIVILMHPEDSAKMRPLEDQFCAGIAGLVEAEIRNGPEDNGLPFKAIGEMRIRVKDDARVHRGSVAVRGSFSEKTAVAQASPRDSVAVLDLGGRELPLKGDLLVGRATYADVVLKSTGVSREHAKLSCRGTNIIVRDLGGPNGTLVNGRRVETARAGIGDEIRFGPEVIGTVRLSARSRGLGHETTEPLS